MNTPDQNCVLVRDQVIPLGEGRTLQVHRAELTRADLVSFMVIVEVSGDAKVVNQLLGNPGFLRGIKIACLYDGVEAIAQLDLWTTQRFTLPSGRCILHFVCSTIEAPQVEGEIFEFILPFVDFGQGDYPTRISFPKGRIWQPFDHLTFSVEGHEWTLRHLFEIDCILYTASEAAARQIENPDLSQRILNASPHALLQGPSSLGQEKAEATVARICWLLNLAFAQPIAWAEMRIRRGRESHFLRRRSFAFPTKVAASKPLRNWMDKTIKTYLEGAYPVFQAEEKWWPETLNWYSIATEHVVLESSSMIFCMLFDRISTKLLRGYKFPKQIGKDLEDFLELKENRGTLAERFGSIMKSLSSGWEDTRSTTLVDTVKGWNDSPPYSKKIAIAFSLIGLKEPKRELLKHRHKLMHEGGVELRGMDAVNFMLDLNEQILALLFAMLKYRGKFFVMGRDVKQMADFALLEAATK
jgi:hypothetical protein